MKIQENRKINKIECNEKVRWKDKKYINSKEKDTVKQRNGNKAIKINQIVK